MILVFFLGMSTLLYYTNFFQLDKLYNFLFLTCLLLIIYFFFSTKSLFLRLLLTLVFIIFNSLILAFFSLDFFSGFLMTAEFPILLVAILFFFQKSSLSFDSVYEYKTKSGYVLYLGCILFICVFWYSTKVGTPELTLYEFSIFDSIFSQHRNDFFLYYQVYYVLYPSFVLFLGTIIFLVSYLVILIYYTSVSLTKTACKHSKNVSFLRKQNFLKQSIYNNKLSFFKKK